MCLISSKIKKGSKVKIILTKKEYKRFKEKGAGWEKITLESKSLRLISNKKTTIELGVDDSFIFIFFKDEISAIFLESEDPKKYSRIKEIDLIPKEK